MEQRLPFPVKFWFGIGQAAEGIKTTAFTVFLLFYYTQVLGLPGYLTGISLMIALLLDALIDPLMGSISDSFRHRWGRRHPFMYASGIPLALCFWLAFAPPAGLGTLGLLVWLTTFAALTRAAMALYHVPHLALGAELTQDYRERSIVVAYRTFFQFIGAVVLIVVTGAFYFRATPELAHGQLNAAAYPRMGLVFGLAMFVTVFVSAWGTHSVIPRLPQPVESQRFSFRSLATELRQALRNPSFRVFFVGMLLFFIARGTDVALYLTMGTYFWNFDGERVTWIPAGGLLAILFAVPCWALASKHLEKRTLFVVGLAWFALPTVLLPLFKIQGWLPDAQSAAYFPTILGVTCFAALGAGAPWIASGSMLADIADEHELETGRRQEGIFFGSLSFSAKAASGLGTALAGMILTLIAFPTQSELGTVPVPEPVLHSLGYWAGPGVGVLAISGVAWMTRYRLDRARHEQILAELAARRSRTIAADSDELAAARANPQPNGSAA